MDYRDIASLQATVPQEAAPWEFCGELVFMDEDGPLTAFVARRGREDRIFAIHSVWGGIATLAMTSVFALRPTPFGNVPVPLRTARAGDILAFPTRTGTLMENASLVIEAFTLAEIEEIGGIETDETADVAVAAA